MKINNISIVLVRPQLPENIGLVARAIDNFGFKKLILVKPRDIWPNIKSLNSSANSKSIINNVKVYDNLNDALSKFNYAIATSNRKRYLNKPFYRNTNECFDSIPLNKKIAIVFGPENSGLSNDDLMLCDSILNIELSNSKQSLNLSHAVLLICYALREKFIKSKNHYIKNNLEVNIAKKKDFIFFMNFLENQLKEIGFLYPKEKSKNMFNNIQTMFLRASLSKIEIQTLWGMFRKFRYYYKKDKY